jgi:hypothetical protein
MGRSVGMVLVLLLAVASAPAQVLPPDADGDGVTDAADACPDTPPFELVDASGCSVCECDPDPAWDSRLDYLRCVSAAVHARRADGTLSRKAGRAVLKAARNSTCGSDHMVRCCIMFPERDDGLCRIMDELRCDETIIHAETVEALDPGSCVPNPCVP